MELIQRYANATFSSINMSFKINSLENLASKQRIHRIVKEQHGFMPTVRSKDRSARRKALQNDLDIAPVRS